MKVIFAIILTLTLFYGCKPGIPKDIIQPEEMRKVLFDIHVVDGYISTLASQDTAKIVASSYYKGIYSKFGIDSAIYNKSLNYYYKHPPIIKKMYDSITIQLNALHEKLILPATDPSANDLKAIFFKDSLDSTLLDNTLNRNYNIKILKNYSYKSFMNKQGYPEQTLESVPVTEVPKKIEEEPVLIQTVPLPKSVQ